jgi:hypothetical protein
MQKIPQQVEFITDARKQVPFGASPFFQHPARPLVYSQRAGRRAAERGAG